MINIYSEKSSGTILVNTIKFKKQTKYILIEHKKPFSCSPSHAPSQCEGQKLFLTKTGSKIIIMVTSNNKSKFIPTTHRQGVSNRDMVGITAQQQTFFSMDFNPGKPIQSESRKVHPFIKRLFLSKSIPDVPFAERLKHFVGAWMRITKDPKILDIVKGHNIAFHSKPFQSKILSQPVVNREGGEFVKL